MDHALVKMDMDGTVWAKTYGGIGYDHNFAFDMNSNGQYS